MSLALLVSFSFVSELAADLLQHPDTMWPRYNLMPGLMQSTWKMPRLDAGLQAAEMKIITGDTDQKTRLNIISATRHPPTRGLVSDLLFLDVRQDILPALKSDHDYYAKNNKRKSRLAPPQQTRA